MVTIAEEAREAKELGRTYFHSTQPCKCGKRLRYVNTRACVECERTRSKQYKAKERISRKMERSEYKSLKQKQLAETWKLFMEMD